MNCNNCAREPNIHFVQADPSCSLFLFLSPFAHKYRDVQRAMSTCADVSQENCLSGTQSLHNSEKGTIHTCLF